VVLQEFLSDLCAKLLPKCIALSWSADLQPPVPATFPALTQVFL